MEPVLVPLLLLLLLPAGLCQTAEELRLRDRQGQCPAPRRSPLTPCGTFCSTDDDCPGSERCCSTGCGRECQLPVGVTRSSCPRPPPGLITICVAECTKDSDCQRGQICCHFGCSIICTAPVLDKPGVCPRRRVLHTFARCNSSCSDDTDCPRNEKCCFTGCGRGCLPPRRSSPVPGRDTWLRPVFSSSSMSSSDVCHLPPVSGPCSEQLQRYAYSPDTGTCQPFVYSGCEGNANNFETAEECQQVCGQPGTPEE